MEFKDNKLRVPLKSFTMRKAIILAVVGAIFAGTGLRFTFYSNTYNISLGFHISPELLLCLGFVVCTYISQVWTFVGALPILGLAVYNSFMILTRLSNYETLAVIYIGAILTLAVFLVLVVTNVWRDRRYFIVGSWGLIVFIFLGCIANLGPYFTIEEYSILEIVYKKGSVLLGKALGAMFLMIATVVWVQVLSRDMNRYYFGDKGTGLWQLSLDWLRIFEYH